MGRSHAVRLAEEGADLILVDICESLPEIEYPLATREDLRKRLGWSRSTAVGRITHVVDVRDAAALAAAVDDGVAELGGLDACGGQRRCADRRHLGHRRHRSSGEPWLDVNLIGTLEHLRRRDAASGRARRQPGQHQLGGGPEGHAAAPPVHGVQARRRRPEPSTGQ